MDRHESTANIIKQIYLARNHKLTEGELIRRVCAYFDSIKDIELSKNDFKFLRYIAAEVGVPHYIETLGKFQEVDEDFEDIDLRTFITYVNEASLHTDDETYVHKCQGEVLSRFVLNENNRFFLSASTSFGKTFLVYEIIRKMEYQNIVLIFPTIALLSENLMKIYSDPKYAWIKDRYAIHTLSEAEITQGNNIFIYTPERFLSFTDKNIDLTYDFLFVDEVYKIDNDYIIDEESKENERDVAYRLAVLFGLLQENTDALLAGPYIDFFDKEKEGYNPSFDLFLQDNNITLLDYNHIEVVNKTPINIRSKMKVTVDNLNFEFEDNSKGSRFKLIVKNICAHKEKSIAYCKAPASVESYARLLVNDESIEIIDTRNINNFIEHIDSLYEGQGEEWIVSKAIKKGIGIHHGLIPKYIQKEIINMFNNGDLNILLSTTTITEGVNTSAKNMIVLSDMKGDKPLKKFDAKNISGRAGRFLNHFSGRVIILKNEFQSIIEGKDECIKHKNYDINSPKTNVDIHYTDDKYLSQASIELRNKINTEQNLLGIPEEIMSSYKVISKEDKMTLYNSITNLSKSDITNIERVIINYTTYRRLNIIGFECILRIIRPIVRNAQLITLIDGHKDEKDHSYLTGLIISYLIGGIEGMTLYNHRNRGLTIDKAVQKSSGFVYNTLKYQVVKYLGAFNLMYKYRKSIKQNKCIDDVTGIDALLLRFEYNSLSPLGRKVSDLGVPTKLVEYYDLLQTQPSKAQVLQSKFDKYETEQLSVVRNIIEV